MMHGVPGQVSLDEQQRLHLARRAFLRHGFNRLDFVAVVAFWISFVLGVTGLESQHNLYVFRMLSCLRIIRLLALTKGNIVSWPFIPQRLCACMLTTHCRSSSGVSPSLLRFSFEFRF